MGIGSTVSTARGIERARAPSKIADANPNQLVRPAGAAISSDTGPIAESAFDSFASGSWQFAYVELQAGVHQLTGDEPFGVIAYGYNGAMSYGYTGGME